MNDISIYFNRVDEIIGQVEWEGDSFGRRISIYSDEFPSLEDCSIAIFSVPEYRGERSGIEVGRVNAFRKQLYSLQHFDHFPSIVDLGDILPGNEVKDTYFALESVMDTLLKKDIIPIIIGGSHDLTFSQYKGYEKQEQLVNLVSIDSNIDIDELEEGLHSENYLAQIITHQPNFLFNYANIGHQIYLNKQEKLLMLEKMYFETLRLGEVSKGVHLSEPLLRNADLLSIDLKALESHILPYSSKPRPNGLNGREICQMAWYAGMSDKLTSLGIYEYDAISDSDEVGAMMIAQILWYFIEGVSQRKGDFPKSSTKKYLKYTVHLNEEEHELIFYKSQKSDRWWVEVPYSDGRESKYFRHLVVPCTYEDYQKASSGEMPDIWWQTFQKLT